MRLPAKTILDYPSYARDLTNPYIKTLRRVAALPRALKELWSR